jgi:two-component system sensor histidine kinase and response regulator WspE
MTDENGGNLGDMSMMDLFRMEAENQCNQLSEDLLALEQDPTASGLLESLMRASHSVKGAARVVELHPAVQIAHAMEDVFVAAQEDKISLDQDGIDMLLQGVDMLSTISQVADDETESFFDKRSEEIESLTKSFSALAKGNNISTDPPAEKASSIDTIPPVPAAEAEESPSLPVDLSDMSMLDLFRMEAANYCTKLSEGLVALENDPSATELLESMMRAAHSMKGAAKIVGLDAAVGLAHAMEDVFVAAQKEKILIEGNAIDILLNSIALLTTIAEIAETESEKWFAEHKAEMDGLIKGLANLATREKATKPPPALKESPETVKPPESVPAGKDPELGKAVPQKTKKKEDKKPARRQDDKEGLRAIRVSAQNMDRIMGLAGESLIESRWLPAFNKNLLQLKYRQDELYASIDRIRENLQTIESDEMTINLFGDLQHKLELCQSTLSQDMEVLEDHARHATNISHRLYKEIVTSKMRPFSEGIRGFARMVRDVARELNKEVNFEIVGPDTMVDLDILDKIEAPLNHMIRNALDHGIEPPDDRVAMGKPKKGTIKLEARHSAGMLSIIVSDDGRGVNLEELRHAIVERKLCGPDMAADLSEHELLEFLFLPNFSTKKKVSKVSGRGVGMDVVHSVINEVRGKIRSSTKLNEGSSFELQLPLTLSVLRALLTEVNGESYAFPLASIDHVLQLTPEQIQEVEGRQYFTSNERRVGLVSAQQIFRTDTPTGISDEFIHVIVFSDRLNVYGLTVDKLNGVRDLVVQRIDPRLGKIKDINSASILEDGTPVLIIDVEDVFRSLDQLISGNRLMRIGRADDMKERKTKRILVADDSITVREVEKKMLTSRGYEVDVAVDGMDAWNTIRANDYDLVVSDIDMPRMNGFELVSLIKNDPNLHNIPVIIVSYKDREEEKNKGLEVGADFYLTKGSFQDEALINAVLDLIGNAEE